MKFGFIAKKSVSYIVLVVLVAIFFIARTKTEQSFSAALVNPKYEIDTISLRYEKEGRSAALSNCGSFWTCDYASPEGKAVFPCDNAVIQKFLEHSRNIVKIYEISDSLKNREAFGLSQDASFCVEFFQSGETVSKLYFGTADLRRRVAFCVDKQEKIYSTNSAILSYLTLSPDFWCDPNIFPESVCDGMDGGTLAITPLAIEKELSKIASLRHGSVFLDEINGFSLEDVRRSQNGISGGFPFVSVDDGKGNVYQAFFMPTGGAEDDYFCRFVALPSVARSEREALAIKSLDYVTTVSAWTFGRIFGD